MFIKTIKTIIQKLQNLKNIFFLSFLALFFAPLSSAPLRAPPGLGLPTGIDLYALNPEPRLLEEGKKSETSIYNHSRTDTVINCSNTLIDFNDFCFYELLPRFVETENARSPFDFQETPSRCFKEIPKYKMSLFNTEFNSRKSLENCRYGFFVMNLFTIATDLNEEDSQNPLCAFVIPDEKCPNNRIIINKQNFIFDSSNSKKIFYLVNPRHIKNFLATKGITYTGATPIFYFNDSKDLFALREFFQNVVNSSFLAKHYSYIESKSDYPFEESTFGKQDKAVGKRASVI